ncbi:MAG: hypothetical protein SGJ18_03165 [Pseudomonadota bacterium]|nr:hypothetical protein [Pseudomonadota bacterium]
MFKILAFLTFSIGLSSQVLAGLDLGMGPISGNSSRLVMGGNVAWNTPGYSVSAHSTGVQTNLYYDSSYYVSLTWSSVRSQFWWGAIHGGFGLGAYFTERGYRETTASSLERASDLALGPSIRIVWDVLGPVYISLEGMYGLRNPLAHLFLSFQDVELISVGFHL